MAIKKIAVTGTKGKTTVVGIVDSVLRQLGTEKVLRVDTNGHFLNGRQKSTTQDSIDAWGMKPTVAPGRFLLEFFKHDHTDKQYAAVMEASLSSGTTIGTGYAATHVAAFLNVFDDHIGSSVRTQLNSREDIAKLKSFIFTRPTNESFLVANADDPLVMAMRNEAPKNKSFQFIYFGSKRKCLTHIRSKKTAGVVYVENETVYYRDQKRTVAVVAVADVPWTFEGLHNPSVHNLCAVVAILYGYYELHPPEKMVEALQSSSLDVRSGRLKRLRNKKNITLIADYAHEAESLRELALLSRRLIAADKKVIGVVRVAFNRSQEQIEGIAAALAEHYDNLIVYDKIDGHWYVPPPLKEQTNKLFVKKIGLSSKKLAAAIKKHKHAVVKMVVREDEAIAYAADLAKDGDAVISIVGDDIERSLGFLKNSFNATIT